MSEESLPDGYCEVDIYSEQPLEKEPSEEKRIKTPVPHTFAVGDLYYHDLPLGLFTAISDGAVEVERGCYRVFVRMVREIMREYRDGR